ncbi:unnamed protein product [Closterium sp. NIES-64]|nr:unnamed protein product [Closterium sp. NIES-64]
MEVARTSMCHAGAPKFLWPQAVRYAAHQLNFPPSFASCTVRDARGVRMETTPVEETTGSTRQPSPASPPGFPSSPQFPPSSLRPVAAELDGVSAEGTGDTGGVVVEDSGSGGAGAGDTGTRTPTPRTVGFLTHVQRLDHLEREERERFERARQLEE